MLSPSLCNVEDSFSLTDRFELWPVASRPYLPAYADG